MNLREIVTCAVNGFEAGVDTKKEAINQIINFVDSNYTHNDSLQALPVEVFKVDTPTGKVEVAGVRFENLYKGMRT